MTTRKRDKFIKGISINPSRLENSFVFLYPWYGSFSIVKYKNTNIKFLVFKRNTNLYSLFPLKGKPVCKVRGFQKKQSRIIRTYKTVVTVVNRREVKKGYEVHHIDHNPFNNYPENLVVVSSNQHRFLHKIFEQAIADFYNTGRQDKLNFYKQVVKKMQAYA